MHSIHASTVAQGNPPEETRPLTVRSMVGLVVVFALVALVALYPVPMFVGGVLAAVGVLY